MDQIVESATRPELALPIGGATIAAGLVGSLPVIINVAVAIYFTLMVVHKAYQMWKEWKQDQRAIEDDPS
jgi:hypothetical protein